MVCYHGVVQPAFLEYEPTKARQIKKPINKQTTVSRYHYITAFTERSTSYILQQQSPTKFVLSSLKFVKKCTQCLENAVYLLNQQFCFINYTVPQIIFHIFVLTLNFLIIIYIYPKCLKNKINTLIANV